MKYLSSKGAVEIDTMPFRYANNALAKLRREAPERKEEIEALAKRCAELDAEQSEENPRAVPGNNNPPAEVAAEMRWDTIKQHMDDLLDQVRGITGVTISEQAQADAAGKLLRDLQDAAKLADQARTAEKSPLDKAVKEIQDRYNAYIAPLKNRVPGLVSKAELALKNQIGAWLTKLDDEKRAREAAAREAAEKAAEEARAAHQAAQVSDDLDEIEAAEELISAADNAARDLRQIENTKSQARGDYRAIGLRSVWKAVRIEGEGGKSLSHYARTQPQRVIAFIQMLADEDVRAGVRTIPGFDVQETKVAA